MEPDPAFAPDSGGVQGATLAQAEQVLRGGGWSVVLDHLVPTLLARLPLTHRFRAHCLRVHHEDRVTVYGRPQGTANEIALFRAANGRLDYQFRRSRLPECPQGPDSFLEAAVSIPFGRLKAFHPLIREQLADLMASNAELMRLRLAILERDFPGDHEHLLRVCWVNGRPTPAGEQLLHPCRPQRPVMREDLTRWFHSDLSALRRAPEHLVGEGISVLHAHHLATPLRPTPAGLVLMGETTRSRPRTLQPDTAALLTLRLPELLYVCRTVQGLKRYLACSEAGITSRVSAQDFDAAMAFRDAADQAEILAMPPGCEPRSVGGSAVVGSR
ncbi:hypothetical protein [Roseateles terrae]|uniref:Uncharacterized protein n=1 Tax=Roseateles terrae TaxID=431060 RepID=A0ABR6GQR9_9BURK|nr:hypothetical protein [Roseateles terrae]MBB3194365.1 hypothetical protein [Roseateles terrae]OWQ88199.1 hypothetical protein CDN98_08715 [Roseateles terrae]